MGIERFFRGIKDIWKTSMKEGFHSKDIVMDIYYPYQKIPDINHLFFDFNSVIHIISRKCINDLNLLLKYIVSLSNNGLTESDNINKIMDEYNLINIFDIKNIGITEDDIYINFNKYFTLEKINSIIINKVLEHLLFIIEKIFDSNKLQTIYIGIDGVPSKGKMIEQRHRRYLGSFSEKMEEKILKEHEGELKNINNDDKFIYNKWKYLINKIHWSKNNISPGTGLMQFLTNELNSNIFHKKLEKITNININLIISDYTERGEAEKKIIDFINYKQNNITKNITVFSPDADMILLMMIIEDVNKVYILRHDQQLSEDTKKNNGQQVYNIIDIDKLKEDTSKYIINIIRKLKYTGTLNASRIINDIVLIFSFFGDDFLPKIESYDATKDIDLLYTAYANTLHIILKQNILEDPYLIKKTKINKKIHWELNFHVFYELLKILKDDEEEILKRNYYANNFHNYYNLMKYITKYINNFKTKYVDINPFNIDNFINDYNFSRDYDELQLFIDDHISSFSTNLNIFMPLINNIIGNTHEYEFKNFIDNIKNQIDRKSLYSSRIANNTNIDQNIQKILEQHKENYIDFITPVELIQELIIYCKTSTKNQLPAISNYMKYYSGFVPIFISKYKNKYIGLIPFATSITDQYYKDKYIGTTKYDIEIYKFHNMLDEYKQKLNVSTIAKLGYKNVDLNEIVEEYIKGIIWIVDYYFNDDYSIFKHYYKYHNSPLINDIYLYLNALTTEGLLNEKIKLLNEDMRKDLIIDTKNYLTPLEQLLFITPFDINLLQNEKYEDNIFSGVFDKKHISIINKFILSTKSNPDLKSFYFNFNDIIEKIYNTNTNDLIDCTNARYLNKCILTQMEKMNDKDILLMDEFRKKMSYEEQMSFLNTDKIYIGGSLLFIDKIQYVKNTLHYKYYKDKYKSTGYIGEKKLYKKYKHKIY